MAQPRARAMMTLVLGGARSGKSRHAVELGRDVERVVFIATATATVPVDAEDDGEMAERIARHRAERPSTWSTIEAPLRLEAALDDVPEGARIVVDCITLWLSNLMFEHRERAREDRERIILDAVRSFAERASGRDVIVVSNEVGQGLVPETAVGREFRDLMGTANQILAARAARVLLIIAGIPIDLTARR